MNKQKYLQALKYYEGDVSHQTEEVYKDPKAYVTLNSIFFSGIQNEIIKSKEMKKLNPLFLEEWEKIWGRDGICDLLFQMMKNNILSKDRTTFRVERLYDFEQLCKANETISFTSTSAGGFLREYGDKEGIVLLECRISKGTPALDLRKILDIYQKPEEAEVLLPPYQHISIEKSMMTKDEKSITDRNGRPPQGKYIVYVMPSLPQPGALCTIDPETIDQAVQFYYSLNERKQYTQQSAQSYLTMKECIQKNLRYLYHEIFIGESL